MSVSKIKTIHGVKKFEKEGRVTFYYDIEFENGDRGVIGKVKENAFVIGQEMDYTLEDGKFDKKKIVESKPEYKPKAKSFNIDGILITQAVNIAINVNAHHDPNVEHVINDVKIAYKQLKEIVG